MASDQHTRLSNLQRTPRGPVRMAVCVACDRMAPVPIRELARRSGEACLVELALLRLRCEECRHSQVEARLCEPGFGSIGSSTAYRTRMDDPEAQRGALTTC